MKSNTLALVKLHCQEIFSFSKADKFLKPTFDSLFDSFCLIFALTISYTNSEKPIDLLKEAKNKQKGATSSG